MGDASLVMKGNAKLAEKRRRAVEFYIKGINYLAGYDLPREAPTLPPVFRISGEDPSGELERRHAVAVEDRERAERIRELVKHRDVLVGQVVGAYSRPPYDLDEFDAIASTTLNESTIAADVKDKVRQAVERGKRTSPAMAEPAEQGVPQAASSRRWMIIAINIAIAVLACVIYAIWARRARD